MWMCSLFFYIYQFMYMQSFMLRLFEQSTPAWTNRIAIIDTAKHFQSFFWLFLPPNSFSHSVSFFFGQFQFVFAHQFLKLLWFSVHRYEINIGNFVVDVDYTNTYIHFAACFSLSFSLSLCSQAKCSFKF